MAASPALAGIGHNSNVSDFDLSRDEIDGLHLEASNWLDGKGVQSQDDADAIGRLLDMIGEAIRTAETRRKAEAKPFDDGKAEIQARYNKLIGDTKGSGKGKAILAREVCQAALTPWRVRQEEERRAAAEAARKAAEEAARQAALAFQVTRSDDLEGREEAEVLARQAKKAETAARRAGKPVATGLRMVVRAEVTDFPAFLRWVRENRPDALRGALQTIAETLSTQKTRGLPGVVYHEEPVAR
ncbi:hypothetical protein [Methylorubrum suomiense]|uniref:Uncharacterized protein n=1 Tax=Methylorubrum suomiense TaxID=144191 RepID=A0ABQ4UYI3_9HYPH|nr:hypothetical protein [Methylorubrum suomiense]GJE77208.1 hypothetical protein BGCPKDLD_3811 [Methylorubrum suomiense]